MEVCENEATPTHWFSIVFSCFRTNDLENVGSPMLGNPGNPHKQSNQMFIHWMMTNSCPWEKLALEFWSQQMSWSSTGTICQRHTGHTCWKTCVALSNSSFLSVSRVRFPIAGWYHILIHSWRLESTCSGQITLEFPRNVTHFIIHIMSLILNYSIWDMILYPPVIKHGLLENQPFSSMTFQLETSSSGISPGHVGWHRVKISWHPQLNIPMIHQMSL